MAQLTDIMPARASLDIVNSGIDKSQCADELFELYFETAQQETAESLRVEEHRNEPHAEMLCDSDDSLADDQPVEQSDEQSEEVSRLGPEETDEQIEDEHPAEQVSDEPASILNMLAEQPNTGVVRGQVSNASAAQQNTAGQAETSEMQIPQCAVQADCETDQDSDIETLVAKPHPTGVQPESETSQNTESETVKEQKTEVRTQESEVGSQKSEDRNQESGVGNQGSAQFGSDRQKHGRSGVEMVFDGGKSAPDKVGQVQQLFDSQKADGPKDIDMQQNVDRVVKAVRANIGRGTSVVQLRLDPPELGTLRIEIRANQSGMSLQIQATSARAEQLLGQNVSELRAALEASGIQTNQIEVELRLDLRNDNLQEQQENQNNDQSRQQQDFQEQFQWDDQGQWQYDEDLSEQGDGTPSTERDADGDIAEQATGGQWQEISFNSVDVIV